MEEIEIIGEMTVIPDFKVPALGGGAIAGNPAIAELIHQRTLLRPKANPDLCTGCGTCVDQCPVSALSLRGICPWLTLTCASAVFVVRRSARKRR